MSAADAVVSSTTTRTCVAPPRRRSNSPASPSPPMTVARSGAWRTSTADFDGRRRQRHPHAGASTGCSCSPRCKAIDADMPVILMTGHGDIPMAVEAIQDGAYDFIAKPFAADRLVQSVRRASEKRRLVMENRRLRQAAEDAQDELAADRPDACHGTPARHLAPDRRYRCRRAGRRRDRQRQGSGGAAAASVEPPARRAISWR